MWGEMKGGIVVAPFDNRSGSSVLKPRRSASRAWVDSCGARPSRHTLRQGSIGFPPFWLAGDEESFNEAGGTFIAHLDAGHEGLVFGFVTGPFGHVAEVVAELLSVHR